MGFYGLKRIGDCGTQRFAWKLDEPFALDYTKKACVAGFSLSLLPENLRRQLVPQSRRLRQTHHGIATFGVESWHHKVASAGIATNGKQTRQFNSSSLNHEAGIYRTISGYRVAA